MSQQDELLDCVIVGAGPAGLTALTYLMRFHRRAVALGGAGPRPRLLLIERTHNLPGYPEGVAGSVILRRLREQAEEMGGAVLDTLATNIEKRDGTFLIQVAAGPSLRARTVILAMGLVDREPEIPGIKPHIGHFLRYCPVCDGYEHTGKQLGIIGFGPSVARHALFLESFSNHITVFLHGRSAETLGRYKTILQENNINFHESRIIRIIEGQGDPASDYKGNGVCLEDGTQYPLAALYSALGCDLHLEPVRHLGLNLDDEGYIITDINQQTSIAGVYAAGDVVSQINQISVAFGQATIAAVRIHNTLDED